MQLGKYQLVAEIARGGMGIVYLAVAHGPARFSKLLVVKELKPELAEDPTFLEMFLEEARLAARLSHPNIVQTYEIGAEGKRNYIVMDYLEGVTLARILRRKDARFTLQMQIRVICEALQGLHYAHSLTDFDGTPLGIVHRDATPQNIFVTFDGQVKLVDFGIAKALDSTVETRSGVLKGKPAYMAPEQISGSADSRSDVFTFGVMLWECVAGRRMWHKKTDIEVLTSIIKGQMPSLKEAVPTAPEALVRIVDRATTANKEERYASGAELQADLEAFLIAEQSHVSTRGVSKLVSEMFTAERTSTRSTIEAHLASIKAGKSLDKIPSLAPPPLGGEYSSSMTPSGRQSAYSYSGLGGLTPTGTPMTGATPPGAEIPIVDATVQGRAGSAQRRLVAFAAVIGSVAILGVVLAAGAGGKTAAKIAPSGDLMPAPAATRLDPSPLPAAAPPMALVTHEITVRVTPSSALITFDGVESSNPAKKTCTAGHRLLMKASVNGYATRERELRCDQDESLELVLQAQPLAYMPAPPPAPPPTKKSASDAVTTTTFDPPKPAAKTPARAPVDVNPAGGTKPTRGIDTATPYGK